MTVSSDSNSNSSKSLTDEEWKSLESALDDEDLEAFLDTLQGIVPRKDMTLQERADLKGSKQDRSDERPTAQEWDEFVDPLKKMLEGKDQSVIPKLKIKSISKDEWEQIIDSARKVDTNSEANIIVWGELFRLGKWFVVLLGSSENDNVRPFTGIADEIPSLMLFTSSDLALEFVKFNKLTEHEDGYSIGSYIIPDALSEIQSLANSGVQRVLFNQEVTTTGYQGPISQLSEMYEWHFNNDERFK